MDIYRTVIARVRATYHFIKLLFSNDSDSLAQFNSSIGCVYRYKFQKGKRFSANIDKIRVDGKKGFVCSFIVRD